MERKHPFSRRRKYEKREAYGWLPTLHGKDTKKWAEMQIALSGRVLVAKAFDKEVEEL